MKIAATEALWDTEQPASFSVFQIGGFTQEDQTPSFDIEIPYLLSFLATESFDGEVQGMNPLQAQYEQQYGPGNYIPPVRTTYWSMRIMAYLGTLVFLVAAVGAYLMRRQRLERTRWFLWLAVVSIAFPFLSALAGWVLSEVGRQPWIVYGLLKTADANSPSVGTSTIALSLGVFAVLYGLLAIVDFVLMRHYARVDPPRGRGRGRRGRAGPGVLMDLQLLWFLIVAFFWAGYFLLEGFDFGVGMLLPVPAERRARAARDVRVDRPRLGRQRGVAHRRRRRDLRRLPGWYATMFSGFYIALLLVLVFLIIRVVSFEWREKRESPRWRATWMWANTIGSAGAALIWGVALANLVHGVPIASDGDFAGNFLDLFSPYTVAAGLAVVLLFAFHGATFLTLKTTGDLLERATHASRRLALPAAVVAGGFLAWTVAVAVDRNDKDALPARPSGGRRDTGARLRRGLRLLRPERLDVHDDGGGHRAAGGDALHRPLPARDGLEH